MTRRFSKRLYIISVRQVNEIHAITGLKICLKYPERCLSAQGFSRAETAKFFHCSRQTPLCLLHRMHDNRKVPKRFLLFPFYPRTSRTVSLAMASSSLVGTTIVTTFAPASDRTISSPLVRFFSSSMLFPDNRCIVRSVSGPPHCSLRRLQ